MTYRLIGLCALGVCARGLAANADPTTDALEAALRRYSESAQTLRREAESAIQARIEEAKRRGDPVALSRLQGEREALDLSGTIPAWQAKAVERHKAAQRLAADALRRAVKDYTRASLDEQAGRADRRRTELERENPRTLPRAEDALAGTPVDDPEAFAAAARAEFDGQLDAIRKLAAGAFEARERAVRAQGDRPGVRATQNERREFDETFTAPKWLDANLSERRRAAERAYRAALERLAVTYDRDKDSARLAATRAEFRRVTDGPAGLSERMHRYPAPTLEGRPWRVVSGELSSGPAEGGGAVTFGDPEWTNYDLRFQVRLKPGLGRVYARFHSANDGSSRVLEFGGYKNEAKDLYNVVQGKWSGRDGGAFVRPGLDLDRWYSIEVRVRGERVAVLMDGTQIIDKSNPNFTRGRIGLGHAGQSAAEMAFRNLEVRTPDGGWLWRGVSRLGSADSRK